MEANLQQTSYNKAHAQGFDLQKMSFSSSAASTFTDAFELMKLLHKLSQEVFKNLSHALELPWEKYLGEMHEFSAPSKDHLRLVKAGETIPNDWSTLVCSDCRLDGHPRANMILDI